MSPQGVDSVRWLGVCTVGVEGMQRPGRGSAEGAGRFSGRVGLFPGEALAGPLSSGREPGLAPAALSLSPTRCHTRLTHSQPLLTHILSHPSHTAYTLSLAQHTHHALMFTQTPRGSLWDMGVCSTEPLALTRGHLPSPTRRSPRVLWRRLAGGGVATDSRLPLGGETRKHTLGRICC